MNPPCVGQQYFVSDAGIPHTRVCSSPNTCTSLCLFTVSFLFAVGWFELEDSKNTNVYVTGLPFDITEDEYTELMSKYGIIKEDDNGVCVRVCVYVYVHACDTYTLSTNSSLVL